METLGLRLDRQRAAIAIKKCRLLALFGRGEAAQRCLLRGVPAGGDVIDPDGDNITAAQLAVDRQIE
jgi:hypothetical protein